MTRLLLLLTRPSYCSAAHEHTTAPWKPRGHREALPPNQVHPKSRRRRSTAPPRLRPHQHPKADLPDAQFTQPVSSSPMAEAGSVMGWDAFAATASPKHAALKPLGRRRRAMADRLFSLRGTDLLCSKGRVRNCGRPPDSPRTSPRCHAEAAQGAVRGPRGPASGWLTTRTCPRHPDPESGPLRCGA